MHFVELAEKRRSIRGYKPDPVPEPLLREVLEAGRLAPTAKNLQPFRFVVVREPAGLDALAKAYPAPFLREAPVVVAVCAVLAEGWTRDQHDAKNYCEVDAAIATDHMTLAAADRGLGSCWIAAFDPQIVAQVLSLPEGVVPVALLPLGWPTDSGREKRRKPLDELVRYERWS